MSNHNTWASPISIEDRKSFEREVQRLYQENGSVEEVTLSYLVDFAVGDRASSASSPYEKKILQAAADATDKASVCRRTQDPILDGTSRLPGDMVICIFGVAARCDLSAAVADTADLLAIANALDASVLRLKQGALRRFELPGDVYQSVGTGIEVATSNTAIKDRGWTKLTPFMLGKDQQLEFSHFNPRTTDWPQAFSVRFMLPALIGRTK